jgi:hypothetical protein
MKYAITVFKGNDGFPQDERFDSLANAVRWIKEDLKHFTILEQKRVSYEVSDTTRDDFVVVVVNGDEIVVHPEYKKEV